MFETQTKMHLAQEYADSYPESRTTFIRHVFKNYLPSINLKEVGAVIMDIGCGTGDVTVELLLPLLPKNYEQYIGADRSVEMIQFCKKTYPRARVDFMILDVEADVPAPGMKEKCDHIFSFFCFHWVVNQRKGFENINYMLKREGSMLVTFIADATNYGANEAVYNNEKWRKYMIDYEKYTKPYLHADDPENELRKILESTGFNVNVCTTVDWDYIYKNKKELKAFLWAINPWVEHMSGHLRDDFIDAIVSAVIYKLNWKDGDGALMLHLKLFVVVAEKKQNLQ